MLAGMALEDPTLREGAWLLAMLPPPRRLMWSLIGGSWYVSYSRDIRRDIGNDAVPPRPRPFL